MKKKKPAKRSGGRAASVAGEWLSLTDGEKEERIVTAWMRSYLGKHTQLERVLDDIDTLAASVLSQKEGK